MAELGRSPAPAHRRPYDVLTMGRVGVDIYPLQTGVGLEDVETFGKFLGGSATNVAVAAAKHGRSAAVITKTGADPFGRFVRRALKELNVDDSHVGAVDWLPTPVVFCEIFPPDDFPLYFYREPKAPDMEIAPEDLDLIAIAEASLFWITATGLSDEPSRSAHHRALEARGRRHPTVMDLDYRAMFWPDRDTARREIQSVLDQVTVAIGNLDECETAVGTRNAHDAGRELLAAGVSLAIVKMGPDGVLGMTTERMVEVPPHSVEVVNGLGAGDGFGGAICHALLSGYPLEYMLRFANAAGAIVASRLECSTAMPSTAEVESLLAEGEAE